MRASAVAFLPAGDPHRGAEGKRLAGPDARGQMFQVPHEQHRSMAAHIASSGTRKSRVRLANRPKALLPSGREGAGLSSGGRQLPAGDHLP